MRLGLITLFFFSCTFLLQSQDEISGKDIFVAYCKACHSIDHNLVGPALKNVQQRRDSTWIYNFIKGSQAMVQAGDSTAVSLFNKFNKIPMPNQNLDDNQISLVLNYILEESTPKITSANSIVRPKVEWGKTPTMLEFSNFVFWIPFTITVILFILMLYYMTIVTDFMKSKTTSNTEE